MGFLKSVIGFIWNLVCLAPRLLWVIVTSPRWIFTSWQRPSLWGSRDSQEGNDEFYMVYMLPALGVDKKVLKKEFQKIFGKECENIVNEYYGKSPVDVFGTPHRTRIQECYSFDQAMENLFHLQNGHYSARPFIVAGRSVANAIGDAKYFYLLNEMDVSNRARAVQIRANLAQYWDEHKDDFLRYYYGHQECDHCHHTLRDSLAFSGDCEGCGNKTMDKDRLDGGFAEFLINHGIV